MNFWPPKPGSTVITSTIFEIVSLCVQPIVSRGKSYIRHRILVGVIQNVVQDVHRCLRLDRNAGTNTEAVDVFDELFRVGLLVAGGFGRLGGG
jgi:hypothetical protein